MKQLDCRGQIIKPGVHVAYNQSGNVVPGVVQNIKGSWYQETWGPIWIGAFFIKNDLDGKVSRVKRAESMMVII